MAKKYPKIHKVVPGKGIASGNPRPAGAGTAKRIKSPQPRVADGVRGTSSIRIEMSDVAGMPKYQRRSQEPGSAAKAFPTHVLRPGQKRPSMAPKAKSPVKRVKY